MCVHVHVPVRVRVRACVCVLCVCVCVCVGVCVMMMIAFITINSGLAPLIQGLSAQILYFRFEIIGDLRSHLLLCSFRRKEQAVSPRSHPAS